MLTLLIFIIILGLLVLVHEWGHFIVAKKSGMRVYEFGFGFPPRLGGVYRDPATKKWKWVFGRGKSGLNETVGGAARIDEFPDTLYSFNWLPLGGFVKIKGESGEAESEPDSFAHKKAGTRLVVLVAGVAMNVIFAALLFMVGFTIGLPADFSGGVDRFAIVVEEPSVVIQQVQKGSPAEVAGLKFGDKIISLDDVEIKNAEQMTKYIRQSESREVEVLVDDGGGEFVRRVVTPRVEAVGEPPRIGVVLVDAGVVRYPWYLSIYKGIEAAFFGLVNIFISLALIVKELATGHAPSLEVSGPVGIAVIVGKSARLGFNYLLNITAMISLSLAAINILPIPALDGGRAFFVVLEKVLRRRLPMKYEQWAHTIGFVLLMALIVLVTWKDIVRLI